MTPPTELDNIWLHIVQVKAAIEYMYSSVNTYIYNGTNVSMTQKLILN